MTGQTLLAALATTIAAAALLLAEDGAGEGADLAPLVEVLGQFDDDAFRLDLLKGMRDGLLGRTDVPMPAGWPAVYAKLSASASAEVREEALQIALVFGDPAALKTLRATLEDGAVPAGRRRRALERLVEKRVADLPAVLHRLLDDPALRRPALRALAAYDDPATPREILRRYASFGSAARQDAVNALAARPSTALALLAAVGEGTVDRRDLPVFSARQIHHLGDPAVRRKLAAVWGEVRDQSGDKQALIADYKARLNPEVLARADPRRGRLVYGRICAVCHTLYGEGGKIGPDITGSNRADLDYLLDNVLDPNAAIGIDYQLTSVTLADGRVTAGTIAAETATSLTVQTLTEQVVVPKDKIETRAILPVSMMPEGLFQSLDPGELADLVAYLATEEQVPLPE